MHVTFAALGGVGVTVDGIARPINRSRERQVLATLIASRNVALDADRIATEVWGADSGPATPALVQVAISRLRSLLEPRREQRKGDVIVSTAAGYLLRADPVDVDVWRFEDLATAVLGGDDEADQVAARCEEAGALWSRPYAGVEAPGPQRHADRLSELHADLVVEHGRALLDLGRAEAAVRLIAPLADEHPFREPLWCLLALAQYRSGRQAEALASLRRLRDGMCDELGVDPSAATLRLEQSILVHDPALLTDRALGPGRSGATPDGRSAAAPAVMTPVDPAPRIVGREAELATGTGLLEEAVRERSARVLLVAGEVGVGKTAYLTELQALARERGFEVLVGRNHRDDLAPALWPWVEIIRPVLDDADPATQQALRPVVTDGPSATQARVRPLRTYDAVLDLLSARAERRPLLLVIDDLHWADTATLRMLRHLASARLPMPVVVAASRRTNDTPSPPLLDCLADLSRSGVARVRLDGLDVDAVGQLLTPVVGEHDEVLAEFVTSVTAGNPFFVLQYGELLAATPDLRKLELSTLAVPEGIKDVLRQRLRQLPDRVVSLVVAASVLGRSIEPEVLAGLVDRPLDEVLEALDLAVVSGLVVEGDTDYAFVHALARDTAYGELSAARRVRMHDRAGRVLEELHGQGAETVSAIARHSWAASSLSAEHGTRALLWRARAAEIALTHHAHAEALALWRDIQGALPPASEAAARAHGGAAVALIHLSRLADAASQIETGVEISRALGAWQQLADLVITLAEAGPWAWPSHGRSRTDFIDAVEAALPHVDDRSQALLLAVLEVEHYVLGHASRRGLRAPVALELSRRLGDDDLHRRVLLFVVVGTTGIWAAPRRLALTRELLALDPRDDLLVSALLSLGIVEWENLHPQAADEAMARCAAQAEENRIGAATLPLAWWRATRARDTDAPDADELLAAALDLHRRSGASAYSDAVALAAARHDDGAEVRQRLESAPPARSRTVRALVAHALLEGGEPERARALIGEPVEPDDPEYSSLAGQCLRLLVLASLGTADEVGAALRPLEEHRGQTVTVSGMVDHCGVVDHFLAAGYAALDDPRAAATAADALRANEALGCLPWARRSAALVSALSPAL